MGVLKLILSVVASQFRSGLAAASGYARDFANSLAGSITSGLTAAAIAEKFMSKMNNAFEEAVELGRMSRRMGVSVEDLQRLKKVASEVGFGMNEAAAVTRAFTKEMVKANSNAGKMGGFVQLGFDQERLANGGYTVIEAFKLVKDAIERTGGSADTLATIYEVFGQKGEMIIQMLSLHADETNRLLNSQVAYNQKMTEAAVRLEKAQKAANAMNTAFAILGIVFNMIVTGLMNVALGLAWLVAMLVEKFLEFLNWAKTYGPALATALFGPVGGAITWLVNQLPEDELKDLEKGAEGIRKGVGNIIGKITDEQSKVWAILFGENVTPDQGPQRDFTEQNMDLNRRTSDRGISSLAAVGGGGLTASMSGIAELNELNRSQLQTQREIASNVQTLTGRQPQPENTIQE